MSRNEEGVGWDFAVAVVEDLVLYLGLVSKNEFHVRELSYLVWELTCGKNYLE